MSPTGFEAAGWVAATTLAERVAALRAVPHHVANETIDADLADQRLQEWRSQSPFATGSSFARRLAADGITEDELRSLLGEPMETVRDRFPDPPAWLNRLAEAFADPAGFDPAPLPLPEPLRAQQTIRFLNLLAPLLRQGRRRLREGIRTLVQTGRALPFDPDTVDDLLAVLVPGPLLRLVSSTMVLELNVARLQGLLDGDTPEARFESFVQRLRQRDVALAILQEYPVLARQALLCIDHWVAFSLEFLDHLCADWEAICALFASGAHSETGVEASSTAGSERDTGVDLKSGFGADPGRLVQIEGGVGDTHRGGRSVQIARFSSGLRLVYKPRSLAVDVHFQELLAWLNERGAQPPFRTLRVLDRGDHGWVEFVEAQPCAAPEEIGRFYARQGGSLALLYALDATDFHFENLIADGEHPILIDLESLCHPRGNTLAQPADLELVSAATAHSVLRVGLLPFRLATDAEQQGVDLSGLGAVEGQLIPDRVLQWERVGTDEMRAIRRQMAMPAGQHRPTQNGAEINVLDYTEDILAGFTHLYRLLQAHREALLAEDGPVARFADDPVRAIVRLTRTYFLLLHESFHPDMLRDALDRDRFFDRLWLEAEQNPSLARVIAAERDDLLRGDIPMFTTRPGARAIESAAGQQIPDFYEEPGMAIVQRRLHHLSEEDLQQQLWFIRASLATLTIYLDERQWPRFALIAPPTIAAPEQLRSQLIAAARAVGDRLEALALRGEQDVTWIGFAFRNRVWSVLSLGEDLYGGLPGVILALAYLGAMTAEVRSTELAKAALNTLRRRLAPMRSILTQLGAFGGWGGLIYMLTHLSALWNDSALIAEAEEMVALLPALVAQDEEMDIVAGCAGCLGSLIGLYRRAPSERTLAVALQCGERLLARAQPMPQGVGWPTRLTPDTALTGFSHGAAGRAWALMELGALTGEPRFQKTALDAILFEHSQFSPGESNWLDATDPTKRGQPREGGEQALAMAWCYGAPGIGLSRLHCLRHLDHPLIRQDLEIALHSTLIRGFGNNHCLCHGDLGNLDLLLQARDTLDESQWGPHVARLTAILLESIRREGWLCGTPLGVEAPGLMNGLAGITYGLLRVAEPSRVPSVLILEPPHAPAEPIEPALSQINPSHITPDRSAAHYDG